MNDIPSPLKTRSARKLPVQYDVFVASTSNDLVMAVRDAIAVGWAPIGGASWGSTGVRLWAQAMTRPPMDKL